MTSGLVGPEYFLGRGHWWERRVFNSAECLGKLPKIVASDNVG